MKLTERIEELRQDRSHGASWMARQAVEAICEEARGPAGDAEELRAALLEAGRRLADSRPEVGAVAGAVGRLLAAAHWREGAAVEEIRRLVQDEGEALLDARTRASRSIATLLGDRLKGATVITHSNSATVREAVPHAPPDRILCTVSRPLEEGRTLAARLAEGGLPVELVEDDEAPRRMSSADLLLLGADTVFRDGTLCNKVGTRMLAQAAAEAGVPVVVACEVIKLAPTDPPAALGTDLFDLTPPSLLTEFVTEEGPFAPEDIQALIDRTPFLREGYDLLRGVPA